MKLSPFVQGYWRAHTWGMTTQQLNAFIEEHVALGVTSVDHAPVYAQGQCEQLFGDALSLSPGLRAELEVVTKFGIYPSTDTIKTAHYDVRFDTIIESVEQSLKRLQLEQIDLLLLHRPCYLMQANEIAKAFDQLHTSGKVREFGVSNFTASQFELLDTACEQPLITNQVEISPLATEHLDNGVLDQAQRLARPPMAWSCLAGGTLFDHAPVKQVIEQVAQALGNASPEAVAYAWVRKLPSAPVPILGTGKIARVKDALTALELRLTNEQWYAIWSAAKGHGVP